MACVDRRYVVIDSLCLFMVCGDIRCVCVRVCARVCVCACTYVCAEWSYLNFK